VAQHVEGYAPNHGQVLRRVVLPGPAGIFSKLHIQDPVLLVFDAPVTAHGRREPIAIRERAQKVPVFGAGLVTDEPGGLDPAEFIFAWSCGLARAEYYLIYRSEI
jgi:hypothetical protein